MTVDQKALAFGRRSDGILVPLAVDENGKIALSSSEPQEFETLLVGDYPTNYFEVESDGTFELHGEATVWDDLEGSLTAARLDTPAGRIDYNYTDLTVDYQANALYPSDLAAIVHQMRHRYEPGTDLNPHLHFFQNQNAVPNFLIAYRIVENGEVPGAFTLLAWDELIYTYPGSGTILQIVEFPEISGSNNLSFAIDIKLYRDTTNVSTLFADVDPYTGIAATKFFDVHYKQNTMGSREEYVK